MSSGRRLEVIARYSFHGGIEAIRAAHPTYLEEIERAIGSVDADQHLTKKSLERRTMGEEFYSPRRMNATIATVLKEMGWKPHTEYVETTVAETRQSYRGPRTVDGMKGDVGLEIQFGKYSFMIYDMVGKLVIFRQRKLIRFGIEVVPMKTLAANMSSGVSFFEQLKADLEARGSGDIDVPIAVLGIGIPGMTLSKVKEERIARRDQRQARETPPDTAPESEDAGS